jgi:hypothetical protein
MIHLKSGTASIINRETLAISGFPLRFAGSGWFLHKVLSIPPPGITPVMWKRLFRKITPARLGGTLILLAGLYLLLIAVFGYFRYLPYFGFFLLCLMGAAFLVITFLLTH